MRSWLAASLLALACTAPSAPATPVREQADPTAPAPPAPPTPPEPPAPPKAPEPPAFVGVDMSSIPTDCKRDADCTNVSTNKCGPCGCANTPIARRGEEAFRTALAAVDCSTYPKHTNPQIACGGCPGYEAHCEDGRCAVRQK
jgi:hypothetical protein